MFRLAEEISKESTCPSRNVGCVAVDPDSWYVVAMGYNGAPSGTEHCGDACAERETGKDYHKCKAVHAEMNAISYAARKGVSLDGCDLYVTCYPCILCARVIIQAGIRNVWAIGGYDGNKDEETAMLFREAAHSRELKTAERWGYGNSR